MSSTSWDKFWKDQRQSFWDAMQIATGYFAMQFQNRFQIKRTDTVFDYGCGPGFVADALAKDNRSITGADINEFYIEQCRKNHPAASFIHITTKVADNEQILSKELNGRRFDYIIVLSVAQYLKSTAELEAVVKMLRIYLKPEGKLVLADLIDGNTSSVKDALSLLFHYIKIGRVFTFIRFMWYLLFSNYRKVSGKMPLLLVPEQAIRDIAVNNNLTYEKINGLTIQKTRCNYVLSPKQ
jgi:2-polyprenyl-3-methyl-5-hydroxy-6-metoxy-1,4-benzoquinol methylase